MSDDRNLEISPVTFQKLKALLNEPKFATSPGTVWSGAATVGVRDLGEPIVNKLIARLSDELWLDPRKPIVLVAFADALSEFPHESDTEDREEFLNYFEAIMDILGVDSSDGMLMRWMYGDEIASLVASLRKS